MAAPGQTSTRACLALAVVDARVRCEIARATGLTGGAVGGRVAEANERAHVARGLAAPDLAGALQATCLAGAILGAVAGDLRRRRQAGGAAGDAAGIERAVGLIRAALLSGGTGGAAAASDAVSLPRRRWFQRAGVAGIRQHGRSAAADPLRPQRDLVDEQLEGAGRALVLLEAASDRRDSAGWEVPAGDRILPVQDRPLLAVEPETRLVVGRVEVPLQ